MKFISIPATDIPLDLLTLADPDKAEIESYRDCSQAMASHINDELAGAILLQPCGSQGIEIVNLAVYPQFQRRGIARPLIRAAVEYSTNNSLETLYIVTGNSSTHQLRLYQQEGFEIYDLDLNYFTRTYPEPIEEDGISCRHRILLRRALALPN